MESYITYCIAGFIAFNENYEIIDYKLFKEDEISTKIIKINHKKIVSEEEEIIENISNEYDIIFIESNKMISNYKELKNYEKLQLKTPNDGGNYLRENLTKVLNEIGFVNFEKSLESSDGNNSATKRHIFNTKLNKFYKKIATLQMKESSQEEDKLLIQAINSIDEIDESIGKLIERIREWYAIYFPEIDIIQNNESYINLISENDTREEIIKNHSEQFNLDISNGADIEDEDLEIIIDFAKSIKSLQKSRSNIEKYINSNMDKIAPNLKNLLGASLGGKLITHVGSLKRLATYPSGTIQIMGAEKALFRHLKTGERPPKHGLIFQHPEVRTSPWWIRGKIARTLALKISLSSRKDFFSNVFDPSISEDFLKKVEKIKKDNPFPKKTKRRIQEEKDGEKTYSKKSKRFKNKKYKNKKRKKRK